VPPIEVRDALCEVFERRNKPGSFRLDNGDPLGSTNDTPPALGLWLIGYDIDMIWNKPRSPQSNGLVERMQGTSSRWAEIKNCANYEELQKRLNEEAFIQRNLFPVSRLKNQTRIEVHPNLEKSQRVWDINTFDEQKTYAFLAKRTFNRSVSNQGQITHFKKTISGMKEQKGQRVQTKLNSTSMEWMVYHDYKVIRTFSALPQLSVEALKNLSIFQ
jgi:transposase InsO family protein